MTNYSSALLLEALWASICIDAVVFSSTTDGGEAGYPNKLDLAIVGEAVHVLAASEATLASMEEARRVAKLLIMFWDDGIITCAGIFGGLRDKTKCI